MLLEPILIEMMMYLNNMYAFLVAVRSILKNLGSNNRSISE